MVYEFLMAQSLAAAMGNTVARYNTTIGCYVAALGFGALLLKRLHAVRGPLLLAKVELGLAALGAAGPIAVLAFDSYAPGPLAPLLSYGWIVAVGFLSGYEMPLVMELAESLKPGTASRALAWDYAGMIVGAVVFPLFLLPHAGLFRIGFVVAAGNALLAVLWFLKSERRGYAVLSFAALVLFGVLASLEGVIRDPLVDLLLMGAAGD